MKNIKWHLTLLAIILLSIPAAGFSYSQMVKTQKLNVPGISNTHPVKDKLRIYGVHFKLADTIIETKIFGLQPAQDGMVRVTHGLFFETNLQEIAGVPTWELETILKKYHYDSIEQFIDEYTSRPPILPKGDFKALPAGLGKELYDFVQEYSNHRMDDLSGD